MKVEWEILWLHSCCDTWSSRSSLVVGKLLFDPGEFHIDPLEAPALPKGRVQERAQVESIVIRRVVVTV
jgi:hypothetical protein